MSNFSQYTLTTAGQNILSNSLLGDTIKFTKMCLGSGTSHTNPADYADMTDLEHVEYTGLFSTIKKANNVVYLTMSFINKNVTTTFNATEAGLYVQDPSNSADSILFAVALDSNPDKIEPASATSEYAKIYECQLTLGTQANVTATVTTAGLLTEADLETIYKNKLIGIQPAYYDRDIRWSGGAKKTQTVLASPNYMAVNINNNGYTLDSQITLDINSSGVWDDISTINYSIASNRAGLDFYIYACVPANGTSPDIKISANSTVPTGYTATTSRKIGGFHCLCVDAGNNISDHSNINPLTDYIAGDILPASVWDLKHRPKTDPEGYAYDEGTDLWWSIYLLSQTGTRGTDSSTDTVKLVSVYNGVIADGTSSEAYHCYKFEQMLGRQKARLPYQREFMCASIGSNQGTNIAGSADPNTTGGHLDTAGRRMISNIGLEDCCGALVQWGSDVGSVANSGWGSSYDGNDHYVVGDVYGSSTPYRVLLGGAWDYSSHCGSRYSAWFCVALYLGANCCARGVSEPLK